MAKASKSVEVGKKKPDARAHTQKNNNNNYNKKQQNRMADK